MTSASPQDPAALATFYGRLLATPPRVGLNDSHWRLAWPAGGVLEIYAPSRSRPQPRQRGRLAVCLQRTAAAGAALHVLQHWVAEAWLLDPEVNSLLLLVLATALGLESDSGVAFRF